MHSQSRFPGLPIAALVVFVGLVFGCQSVERSVGEGPITAKLVELVPDGRVYPNDLATDRAVGVSGSWLFDREVLIEDNYGRFTSLNRGDLGVRWYYAGLPSPVDMDPAAGPLSVAFLSKGMLYEVERDHGIQLHVRKVPFIPSAAVAISDSTVYAPCLATPQGNQTLLTMNLANGLTGWGMATRGSVVSSPVYYQSGTRSMMYFATENGSVFAFPAESAASPAPVPAWSLGVHGRVVAAPVVSDLPESDNDLLFVTTGNGELWALDLVTGVTGWVCYSGAAIDGPAWPAGDQVYFRNLDGVHAVARADGQKLWSIPVDGEFLARRGDTVYIRTRDNSVHAVSAAKGEILRTVTFPATVRFLPNTKDGYIYAVTERGFVFAVGPKLP